MVFVVVAPVVYPDAVVSVDPKRSWVWEVVGDDEVVVVVA